MLFIVNTSSLREKQKLRNIRLFMARNILNMPKNLLTVSKNLQYIKSNTSKLFQYYMYVIVRLHLCLFDEARIRAVYSYAFRFQLMRLRANA